jgi:hypothetical protein
MLLCILYFEADVYLQRLNEALNAVIIDVKTARDLASRVSIGQSSHQKTKLYAIKCKNVGICASRVKVAYNHRRDDVSVIIVLNLF